MSRVLGTSVAATLGQTSLSKEICKKETRPDNMVTASLSWHLSSKACVRPLSDERRDGLSFTQEENRLTIASAVFGTCTALISYGIAEWCILLHFTSICDLLIYVELESNDKAAESSSCGHFGQMRTLDRHNVPTYSNRIVTTYMYIVLRSYIITWPGKTMTELCPQ